MLFVAFALPFLICSAGVSASAFPSAGVMNPNRAPEARVAAPAMRDLAEYSTYSKDERRSGPGPELPERRGASLDTGSGTTRLRPELVEIPAPTPNLASHSFGDWQNVALFSGVTAARTFDYLSTRKFRQKHLKEWFLDDKIVDNRPLFLTIEAAGVFVSVGVSYLLHRTGHHRLERWASIIHIGVATAGGIWNCTLPNGL